MNYNYAICIPRKNKPVYNWTMPLESIDKLFTTRSKSDVLSWLKLQDSILEETDSDKILIMRSVSSSKYISERYTYIITNPNYLNFDIAPFLLHNEKLVRKLHSILIHYEKRRVSENFKNMIYMLINHPEVFVKNFPYLPYEEKRVVWTILSEDESVSKVLNQEEIEVLEETPILLQRKAS